MPRRSFEAYEDFIYEEERERRWLRDEDDDAVQIINLDTFRTKPKRKARKKVAPKTKKNTFQPIPPLLIKQVRNGFLIYEGGSSTRQKEEDMLVFNDTDKMYKHITEYFTKRVSPKVEDRNLQI